MTRRSGSRLMVILGGWLVWSTLGDGATQVPPKLENLADHKAATASSFQTDDKAPDAAFDGDPETRWCASSGSAPQWLQVDLGKPEVLTGCRIVFEHEEAPYFYKVEGSKDGTTWTTLADRSRNSDRTQIRTHSFDAKGVRQVRLTMPEVDPDHWASVIAFEVFGNRPAPAAAVAQAKKTDDRAILRDIKAPEGFEVTAFAGPPNVRYPTCLAASPTGEVFVGIDENGSLDAKEHRGRVVRCVDTDDDGKADQFNVFAEMDSPRGVVWDAGTLYVLHPPNLTAFIDDNNDGVSDRTETLIQGIGFDLKFRGADHTTNGIRLGIDGYLYIAVGDYGFIKATAKDGTTLAMLGGGVARVRIDGTGFEVVSRGQRNIYDVAVAPTLDLFTRDNTNDGDGWDVRLSQVVPTAHYGYPSLFKRFPEEHLAPMADYGGGSPCGSLYLQEPGFPEGFGDTLYTCEWGRGGIFRHPMTAQGAGFKAGQEMFVTMPRPTDMDVDARGRIFVSSWKDGGFTYSKPEIGYVIRLKVKDSPSTVVPDFKKATDDQLVAGVGSASSVVRLAAQRQLLRKGLSPEAVKALEALAVSKGPIAGRVAALFTIRQGLRGWSIAPMIGLAKSAPEIREFVIKALGDSRANEPKVEARWVAGFLNDPDPRVRLQSVIALGRLGQVDQAPLILPMTSDPDPLVAHVAVKALVKLDAVEVGLSGLDNPKLAPAATQVLQSLHEPRVILALIKKVEGSRDSVGRRPALKALCRLYFREAPYEGKWWGTRPDTSGPYYSPVTWEGSESIGKTLRLALKQSDDSTARWLLAELLKNKIDFEETTTLALKLAAQDPSLRLALIDLMTSRKDLTFDAIKFLEKIATSDPDAPSQVKAIRALIRHASQPESRDAALRALALVGERDDPSPDLINAWLDYTRDNRQQRDAGTAEAMAEGPDPGQSILGYGILLQAEAGNRTPEASRTTARKVIEAAWENPKLAPRLLRAVGLAKSKTYDARVKQLLASTQSEVRQAAEFAGQRLGLAEPAKPGSGPVGKPIATTAYELVLATVLKDPGDPVLGATLFEKQGCVNCHSVAKADAIKGPYLGDITTRYNRAELTESILKPSVRIAQGFETQKIALNSGQIYEGFVVREAGDEIEMRNSAGAVTILSKKEIDERGKSELSVMPQGLVDPLTPHDLASILAYLESLKGR